jgi:MFS family permease
VTGGLLDLPSFTKYFTDIDTADPAIQNDPAVRSQRSLNQGIAVASYNLGCFFGAILTVFIGNPLGRRRTIFCGCVIMATGALLQATAFHLPHFIVGRIVTGVGNGMNTSTVPTWQSEAAKSHDRGKMVMIEGMLITAGITLSYWINYGRANMAHTCKKLRFLMTRKQDSHSSGKAKWPGGSRLPSKFFLPS